MSFPTSDDALGQVKNLLTDIRLSMDDADDRWWSALITLQADGALVSIDGFLEVLPPSILRNLIVPVQYSVQDRSTLHSRFYLSVIARKAVLDTLNHATLFPMVENVDLGTHVNDQHIDFSAEPQETPKEKIALPKGSVIMGIIDDGIAIAHNLLRKSDTVSRVLLADLQAVDPDRKAANATYGRRLTNSAINALLEQYHRDGLLDETGFYQATGQLDYASSGFDPLSQSKSHGTHVAALAAGFPIGDCGGTRPIICATLPSVVTVDVTGQSLMPSLALALHSVLSTAKSYILEDGQGPVPIVLNFSYGNTSGPHDGRDDIDHLLSWHKSNLEDQKLWITLPAGNSNLAQGHAEIPLEASHPKRDLTWMILPDDNTASHVEMWLPYGLCEKDMSDIQVTVTSPSGLQSPPLSLVPGHRQNICNTSNQVVGHMGVTFRTVSNRALVNLTLFPTFRLSRDDASAEFGRWTISVDTSSSLAPTLGALKVWVQRDRSVPGYRPNGRQSYFIDPEFQRFGEFGQPIVVDPPDDRSLVRRSGTLSGLACGDLPVVVASWNERARQVSYYSSSGPLNDRPDLTPDRTRFGPDLAAKGDDSLVLPGVLSAGTRSGSMARMVGTSMSAPRLARFAADHIAQTDLTARAFMYEYLGSPTPESVRDGAGYLPVEVPWRGSAKVP